MGVKDVAWYGAFLVVLPVAARSCFVAPPAVAVALSGLFVASVWLSLRIRRCARCAKPIVRVGGAPISSCPYCGQTLQSG